jgi:accessory colonization factor AcfC
MQLPRAISRARPDTCEAVELPRDLQVYMSTAAQVVSYTYDEELSRSFIDFFVSLEGRRIYSDDGWLHELFLA